MATMILPVEASGAHPRPADAIFEIMHDITLSMGEKLLLIEGLFVHDLRFSRNLTLGAGVTLGEARAQGDSLLTSHRLPLTAHGLPPTSYLPPRPLYHSSTPRPDPPLDPEHGRWLGLPVGLGRRSS